MSKARDRKTPPAKGKGSDADWAPKGVFQEWEQGLRAGRDTDVRWLLKVASRAVASGECYLGCEVSQYALDRGRCDRDSDEGRRFRQIWALSLARAGSFRSAQAALKTLVKEGAGDSETLGILARTYKDLGFSLAPRKERTGPWTEAFRLYSEAFSRDEDIYPGINAAAMALLLGNRDEAKNKASAVLKTCRREEKNSPRNYWILATKAEALLILGRRKEAFKAYGKASSAVAGRWADLASTRRQARFLADILGIQKEKIDAAIAMPRVGFFSGHMVDRLDRETPRFPAKQVSAVRESIDRWIESNRIEIGYCSAAAGGDILFIEALLKRQAEVCIVLPVSPCAFRRLSVEPFGKTWVKRFDRALDKASRVVVLGDDEEDDAPASIEFGNWYLFGIGAVRARILGTELRCLLLWDGLPARGRGGTAEVARALSVSKRTFEAVNPMQPDVRVVHPNEVRLAETPFPSTLRQVGAQFRREVRAVLLAKVVNFYEIRDRDFPAYLKCFLERAADLFVDDEICPEIRNSLGDSILCVFDSVARAGRFARRFREQLSSVEWKSEGNSSPPVKFQIILHAGPVTLYVDPIINQSAFGGTNIDIPRRLESPPFETEVIASENFVALAAWEENESFEWTYLGRQRLMGSDQTVPVFLLQNQPRNQETACRD